MASEEIKVGELVMLNSGGATMTVKSISYGLEIY
jgi:uncharacterized protein YodC (DUF2158 family)